MEKDNLVPSLIHSDEEYVGEKALRSGMKDIRYGDSTIGQVTFTLDVPLRFTIHPALIEIEDVKIVPLNKGKTEVAVSCQCLIESAMDPYGCITIRARGWKDSQERIIMNLPDVMERFVKIATLFPGLNEQLKIFIIENYKEHNKKVTDEIDCNITKIDIQSCFIQRQEDHQMVLCKENESGTKVVLIADVGCILKLK